MRRTIPKFTKAPFTPGDIADFRPALLAWFDVYQRDLPWRRSRDPYEIWISEIMLQQSRVAAVIPFFERFLTRFPNFQTLAAAPEPDVLALWAGLGYYHRARNLQKSAATMTESGAFPRTYESIRALPGIGEYTSAAVASIGFDLPHAAVDGNVVRVVSRVFDDPSDAGTAHGRRHFTELASQLLDRERPGAFNQAMMELGATVCLPKNPRCLTCPVSALCRARQHGTQHDRPVKQKKAKSVRSDRVLFWIERDEKLLLWQRPPDSRLMAGFWELPEREQIPVAIVGPALGALRHGITVHDYRFEVHAAEVPAELGPCTWISVAELARLPLSTIARKAVRIAGARHFESAALATAASR